MAARAREHTSSGDTRDETQRHMNRRTAVRKAVTTVPADTTHISALPSNVACAQVKGLKRSSVSYLLGVISIRTSISKT
jgi:hypothetical protein